MVNNRKLLSELAGEVSLGERLKFARERAEMTQQELGDQLGKSPKYVSDVENDRRMPSLETLIEMAKVTGDIEDYYIKLYFKHQLKKANVDDRFEIIEKSA
tara:strand:- start:337 stop:639 length:303 start_codon:yes stop_codon:yes gene_type:complete